jgi:hypothetical protein
MKNRTSGCPLAAAERFARFQERPDVKLITAKYADFVATPEGIMVTIQLSCEAIKYLSGITSRHGYETAIGKLAAKSGIPLTDLRLLAETHLELTACALVASGQCSKPSGA